MLFKKESLKTPSGLQLYQKETSTQVLSCKFCEIFEDTYFEKHSWTAAFEASSPPLQQLQAPLITQTHGN